MQARPVKLGHVGIAVEDIDAGVAFYTEQLGLRLTERFTYEETVGHGVAVRAGAFVRCDATHHAISIFQLTDPDLTKASKHRLGLHHIAFEFASPEDLLSKYRQVRDAGVTIVNCRVGGPGNHPRFYAKDMDGNLLEFYWGIDQIGWDGLPRVYPPITEIDLEAFDFVAFRREFDEAQRRMIEQSSRIDGVAVST
ncbi:VOC family protein [Psychromarinibacter sp. C21-152]|uniref:VOC family protein n=1 Tax=Psychromarinibacter sediminicola TaxID=3033385 RepID=A0AAE3NPB4_9RHOB|nr:VOC family protein [Psychromarinibacter sediminicola]MDF0601698.1 VOC family protein [Psychromarinibacter sediminicola]